MPTTRVSPGPRQYRAAARWPHALPAMVDSDTNDYVRGLSARRGESLAETLRHLLDLGITAERKSAKSLGARTSRSA